jgi:hypothetical protein
MRVSAKPRRVVETATWRHDTTVGWATLSKELLKKMLEVPRAAGRREPQESV